MIFVFPKRLDLHSFRLSTGLRKLYARNAFYLSILGFVLVTRVCLEKGNILVKIL